MWCGQLSRQAERLGADYETLRVINPSFLQLYQRVRCHGPTETCPRSISLPRRRIMSITGGLMASCRAAGQALPVYYGRLRRLVQREKNGGT